MHLGRYKGACCPPAPATAAWVTSAQGLATTNKRKPSSRHAFNGTPSDICSAYLRMAWSCPNFNLTMSGVPISDRLACISWKHLHIANGGVSQQLPLAMCRMRPSIANCIPTVADANIIELAFDVGHHLLRPMTVQHLRLLVRPGANQEKLIPARGRCH